MPDVDSRHIYLLAFKFRVSCAIVKKVDRRKNITAKNVDSREKKTLVENRLYIIIPVGLRPVPSQQIYFWQAPYIITVSFQSVRNSELHS